MAQFPTVPAIVPPAMRNHLMNAMKTRVASLVWARQHYQAAHELAECLSHWRLASTNVVENLCIAAMLCSSDEFLDQVMALR